MPLGNTLAVGRRFIERGDDADARYLFSGIEENRNENKNNRGRCKATYMILIITLRFLMLK